MTLLLGATPVTAHLLLVQGIKSVIVVVLLVVAFRLLGKREAAQLNLYDLALLMALANAVQNSMTAGKGDFRIGLVCSSVVLATAWAVSKVIRRDPDLEHRLIGSPTLLVHQGRVLTGRLRREHVSHEELLEACRQRGLQGPHDVDLAVLEVDGSISIIPRT